MSPLHTFTFTFIFNFMTTRARIPRLIFFGLLALIAFSELIFSNLGTLTGDLTRVATMLGLTLDQERTRLLTLIVLDAIAGVGAALAFIGLVRPTTNNLLRSGSAICALGLVGYGLYQLLAALTQLPETMRAPIAIVGLVYVSIGVLAWSFGRKAS